MLGLPISFMAMLQPLPDRISRARTRLCHWSCRCGLCWTLAARQLGGACRGERPVLAMSNLEGAASRGIECQHATRFVITVRVLDLACSWSIVIALGYLKVILLFWNLIGMRWARRSSSLVYHLLRRHLDFRRLLLHRLLPCQPSPSWLHLVYMHLTQLAWLSTCH